jgi:hypothetical protein
MNANFTPPTDRAAFDGAINAIFADHAMLRHLADAVVRGPANSADAAMSLADAMAAHESAEARLFALPFLTRPPGAVTSSAARARQRCVEYTSGNYRLPNPEAAAAVLVDALLAHMVVEDAWLAQEQQQHHDRLLKSI